MTEELRSVVVVGSLHEQLQGVSDDKIIRYLVAKDILKELLT